MPLGGVVFPLTGWPLAAGVGLTPGVLSMIKERLNKRLKRIGAKKVLFFSIKSTS
jgi:hypothetical protein